MRLNPDRTVRLFPLKRDRTVSLARVMIPGLYETYSLWGNHNGDCSLLLKRLRLTEEQLIFDEELELISEKASVPLRFDLVHQISLYIYFYRNADILTALCTFAKGEQVNILALRAIMSIIEWMGDWKVMPNVDRGHLVMAINSAILHSSFLPAEVIHDCPQKIWTFIGGLVRKWISKVDADADEADKYRQALNDLMSSIASMPDKQWSGIGGKEKHVIYQAALDLINGSVFDLREMVGGASSEFRLQDVVQEHFPPCYAALRLLLKLVHEERNEEHFHELKSIISDYFHVVSSFLVNVTADEPFLCGILQLLLGFYKEKHLRMMATERERVVSLLDSFKLFVSLDNFAAICPHLIDVCVSWLQEDATFAYQLVGTVRTLLLTIGIKDELGPGYPDRLKTVAELGDALGLILHNTLPMDRIFCESLASNLSAEFDLTNPQDALLEERAVRHRAVAVVFGHMAVTVQDDSVARICLTTLVAKMNGVPLNEVDARSVYFAQLNRVAVAGNGSVFNIVMDNFMRLAKQGVHPVQTYAALSNLTEMLKSQEEEGKEKLADEGLKREVLVISLVRLFIEKGVASISVKHDRKKSGADAASNAADLDLLLPVIERAMQTDGTSSTEGWKRGGNNVEIFQEFWLTLVFIGYLPSLKWKPEWTPLIPLLAKSSPILLKERDKLQSPGSTFSQMVLAQSMNPSLRNHLSGLLPNSAAQIRNINFAQCLWLLAIYFCESGKFKAGIFADINAFLRSEIIDVLGLYPFVEDLFKTIVEQWKDSKEMLTLHDATLAELLVANLGFTRPRTHSTSIRLLRSFFVEEDTVCSNPNIWRTLSVKAETLYSICRLGLGAPELALLPGDFTRDPAFAQKSFEDVIGIIRLVYDRAQRICPNLFANFAQAMLDNCHRQGDVDHGIKLVNFGDRNVTLLELMQLSLPSSAVIDTPDAYLSANSLLYRNTEDFVRFGHHSCKDLSNDHLMGAICGIFYGEYRLHPWDMRSHLRVISQRSEKDPLVRPLLLHHLMKACLRQSETISLPHEEPFRAKLTAVPSISLDHQAEGNLGGCWMILLDYLSECMTLDALHHPPLLALHMDLATALLQRLARIPSLAAYRVLALAFDALRLLKASKSPLHDIASQAVYWNSQEFLATSIPLVEKVPQYAGEHLKILSSISSLIASDALIKSSSTAMSPAQRKRRSLGIAMNTIIQCEARNLRVWSSLPVERRPISLGPEQGVVLREISLLSLSLWYRVVTCSGLQSSAELPSEAWLRNSRQVTKSSSLATFLLDSQRSIVTMARKDDWIYGCPLLIPSAISSFRLFAKQAIILNLAMRSLESSPEDVLYFYIPQLVQSLRHDPLGFIERSILHIAKVSALFAHQIIWNMNANAFLDEAATQPDAMKPIIDRLTALIIKQFTGDAQTFYQREFTFFEKVTNISGALKPYVKREKAVKKAKIDEELAKIAVDPGVYLPSNPEYMVVDIDYASGRPLQSHAKAPFMATFKVRPTSTPTGPSTWQSAIFKVGDDCRQDVLALQLISAFKKIFEVHGLPLYLYPYRVIATAPGCGVIEVIPNSISRDQLGREKINSLYEYLVFRFGGEDTPAFHQARINFVRSMAAYSVLCYLISIKDRHNGNIMMDEEGHIIHIDFGFILDIAPGPVGLTFESAPFKLSSEMLQVMGGSGGNWSESPYYRWFCELCVQAFLVARLHCDQVIHLVETMLESGLPCFKGEKTIRNLRQRFRMDLDVAGAREHMLDLISKSGENVRTAIYDRYQLSTNGIPY